MRHQEAHQTRKRGLHFVSVHNEINEAVLDRTTLSLRYRSFVPPVLALLLLERSLHLANAWFWKTPSGHHPPEHYAVLVGVPVILLALMTSLRDRDPARAGHCASTPPDPGT